MAFTPALKGGALAKIKGRAARGGQWGGVREVDTGGEEPTPARPLGRAGGECRRSAVLFAPVAFGGLAGSLTASPDP